MLCMCIHMYTYIHVYTGMYLVLSIHIYSYRYMHTHKEMCDPRECSFQGNALCVYLCTYIYSGIYLLHTPNECILCYKGMYASRECILLTIEGALLADFSEFTSDMQIWQGKLQKFSQISTLGVLYDRFSRTMTFENLHQVCRYGRASCINLQVTFAPTAQQLPTLERIIYK